MSEQWDTAVVGAGIVGVCCALRLQAEGRNVLVIDRAGPGEGCSKGNAGHLATEQIAPLSSLRTVLQVPRMLLEPNGPLNVRWSYLPQLLPWLTRFLLAGRPSRTRAATRALGALNGVALRAYEALEREIGLDGLLHRDGTLLVADSERGLSAMQNQFEFLHSHGVRCRLVPKSELKQLDPALNAELRGGLHFPDSAHIANPHRLVRHLADAFVRRGGTLLLGRVEEIHSNGAICRISTATESFASSMAVIAAGAWSAPLAAQLGHRVPLDTERGYHLMLKAPSVAPRLPVSSHEQHFVMTPMEHGLRIAGRVELAGLDAPMDPARATKLLELARGLLPALTFKESESWMGFRPTLPDSLPVIDRSRHLPNVLFAFGHHHLGLTQAAVTSELIADLACERRPSIDLTPFRIDRFGGAYRYRAPS